MRILTSLLLLLSSVHAFAQTPQVDRIDIVDYGIYTAGTKSKESLPGSAAGALTIESDIRLVKTTRTVPAQEGIEFGSRALIGCDIESLTG